MSVRKIKTNVKGGVEEMVEKELLESEEENAPKIIADKPSPVKENSVEKTTGGRAQEKI